MIVCVSPDEFLTLDDSKQYFYLSHLASDINTVLNESDQSRDEYGFLEEHSLTRQNKALKILDWLSHRISDGTYDMFLGESYRSYNLSAGSWDKRGYRSMSCAWESYDFDGNVYPEPYEFEYFEAIFAVSQDELNLIHVENRLRLYRLLLSIKARLDFVFE